MRPVLALPVLLADLVGFSAMHLQHALHQPLFELFLNRNRSVLSTTQTAFVLTPQNATKAALLTAPLLWGCYFLNVFLYTAALLTVARMLDKYESGGVPYFNDVKDLLWKNKRRLLQFSGLAFFCVIVQLPLTYMVFALGTKMPSFTALNGRVIGYAIAFIVEAIAMLLLTKPVLNFLGNPRPENEALRLAKVLGFLTLLAQFAIIGIVEHLLPYSYFEQRTVAGLLVREAFTSMLGALPYIPLFVGLAIIAQTSREIAIELDDFSPPPTDGFTTA